MKTAVMREHNAREGGDDLPEAEKLVSTDLNPGGQGNICSGFGQVQGCLKPTLVPGHGLAYPADTGSPGELS